jgi:hypothetical protein
VKNRIQLAIGRYEDLDPDHSQKRENEVVWTRNKIQRTVKDNSARNGAWSEEERQTEKEMGRQHPRVDRTKAGRHHTSGRGQREMERAGCEVFSDAQTVIQTTG